MGRINGTTFQLAEPFDFSVIVAFRFTPFFGVRTAVQVLVQLIEPFSYAFNVTSPTQIHSSILELIVKTRYSAIKKYNQMGGLPIME